ncbi:MAG: FkbM family methyltransferase [Acidimicrobiales bacterium]|nr:FkbM family methyltransferase [Acidimicrobiales bacterium]
MAEGPSGVDGDGTTFTPASDEEIVAVLNHPDRAQLLYQVLEIVRDECYIRNGVTVEPGSVVLDVGANAGVSAAFFALRCGAVVHSFEAARPVFEILEGVTARLPGCFAHNFAVGRTDGSAEIAWYPHADAMSSLYADQATDQAFLRSCLENTNMPESDIAARVADLDDVVRLDCELRRLSTLLEHFRIDHVSLLKIDVERAELDVLAGIDPGDWPRIGQVVAEVHDEEDRLLQFTDILADQGFEVIVEEDAAMTGTGVVLVYATRPRTSSG